LERRLAQPVRFGDYVQEVNVRHHQVSYRDLQSLSAPTDRIRVGPAMAFTILRPYLGPRFAEQLWAVGPLAAYLAIFQVLVLQQRVEGPLGVVVALVGAIFGLMLFMEGVKLALMPLGARLGETLPTHSPLPVVLAVVFLLGIGCTFAEPAIGALQAAGALVGREEAPALYSLLNHHTGALVLTIAGTVGLAAVVGTLRFVYSWSLKPLIYATLIPLLALTAYGSRRPDLAPIVGLAWDSGGVTTGPITVPLVLALGIGVSHAVGRGGGSLSGFGIVALASLFPILGVMILGLLVQPTDAVAVAAAATGWWTETPWAELVESARAIVPLVLFLLLLIRGLLKREITHPWMTAYGVVLTLVGLTMFNVGLTAGLVELGQQAGRALPSAFVEVQGMPSSPLYIYALGVVLVIVFAWVLGFGSTMAEPALNAVGITVEELTNGAFSRRLLLNAVAIGVGCGLALGVGMIVFGWPLIAMLLVGYAIVLALTFASSEEMVNVAWDSAAVTTGPVTVPLVIAMGLALGTALRTGNGFGVVALASLVPIASVLLCGLYIDWTARRRHLL
jgi:hypothetical protein